MDAIRMAVVDFSRVTPDEARWHRRRMELILRVPTLTAHSTLRFAAWRQVIAGFVAERTGQPADSLLPSIIAMATLGVAIAAYEQWLEQPGADLSDLLDTAMRTLAGVYSGRVGSAPQSTAP